MGSVGRLLEPQHGVDIRCRTTVLGVSSAIEGVPNVSMNCRIEVPLNPTPVVARA